MELDTILLRQKNTRHQNLMINIKIGDKEYKVKEATSTEEKTKGLQGIEELPEDEGMLFYFDPPEDVQFWMKDVNIPLDIVFIDDDEEVVKVQEGIPNDETLIEAPNVAYVLEVNANSGIQVGDELDFEEEEKGPVMKVLAQDGSDQYELWGGERIFSRKNTKILIKKAKKANASQDDKDFKSLGKYIFKCIRIQDEREPEYVESAK